MAGIAQNSLLFEKFCAQARELKTRSEITFEEVPAPQRLAPLAVAFSVDVSNGLTTTNSAEDSDVATGRFVMLHDPDGQDAWEGNFRAVTFVRSAIEDDLQSDPLLTDVAWSWVSESLESANASFAATSGTVTRVSSASYGQLSEKDQSSEIEIRASWTPVRAEALINHIDGWIKLIEVVSGLAPIAEGVSSLKSRR
ncbi:MAG: hypothetical protein RLZZ12_241 [Actinomycetota bacterium]|jgi:hypothetical protein